MTARPRSIKIPKFFAYLVVIVFLTMMIGTTRSSDAALASVFLQPSSQTVGAVGVTFAVNVSITGVSNLYGYQVKLYYNSTLMNGTQVAEGPFLKSDGGQTLFDVSNFNDDYNATYGIVWVDNLLTTGVLGVNGAGVLITVQFKSLTSGNAVPLHLADVQLSDPNSNPIPYEALSDGTVTVVPELTSQAAILSLIAASLLVILIGKRTAHNRLNKRRNILTEAQL